MNRYFSSIHKITNNNNREYSEYVFNNVQSFQCLEIEKTEVLRSINKLDSKKYPGYDDIDAKTLKILSETHINFLTSVLNNLIDISTFPNQLKNS